MKFLVNHFAENNSDNGHHTLAHQIMITFNVVEAKINDLNIKMQMKNRLKSKLDKMRNKMIEYNQILSLKM